MQRIPTIDPVVTDTVSQPEDVTSKAQLEEPTLTAASGVVEVQKESVSSRVVTAVETPHIQVETEEAREARLDKQWKMLKVDVSDLPDVYAKLAKIKLTGREDETSSFYYRISKMHA